MEHSDNLTPEHICNENNASDFTKMTGDSEMDPTTTKVTNDLDRETIPTTMLTPPPTSEPLLNGSSRSSTSGNDLQQFTGDGIMQPSPELSPQADDGNSNQSENSDSADSKLIINEGSIDSNDIADVNQKTNEPISDEIQQNPEVESQHEEAIAEPEDEEIETNVETEANAKIETETNEKEQQEEDGDASEENEVEEKANESSSRPLDVDTNQKDETLCETNSVANQVISDEVIAISDGESRINNEQSPKPDESTAVETSQNVPSQSINGNIDQTDHCEPSIPSIEFENEDRLANESHIEHRKLKRKLSDSNSDTYENPQKQTKFHNQTNNSIGFIDNQTDLADSIANHVVNHTEFNDNCDNLMLIDDSQNSRDAPTTLAKSQTSADENFHSELTNCTEPVLSATTKENTNDEPQHKYMNGHLKSNTECVEEVTQKYNHQLKTTTTCNTNNDVDDVMQTHDVDVDADDETKHRPASPQIPIELTDNIDQSDIFPDPNRIDITPPSDQLRIEPEPELEPEKDSVPETELVSHQPADVSLEPENSSPNDSKLQTSNDSNVSDLTTKTNSNNSSMSNFSYSRSPHETIACINESTNLAKETMKQRQKQLHQQPNSTIIPFKQQQQNDNKRLNTQFRLRRQVFMCSACGTYYEKWNLFYHIREVHNKFICLFENCLGIFPNAERLVMHLESKHVHKPYVYEHRDDLLRSLRNQCFLMCCDCEHIFTENDDVTAHSCDLFKKPCTVCGLKSHRSNCSMLLASKSTKHKLKRTPATINSIQPAMQSPTPMPIPIIGHNADNITSQTFLRNALMSQEPRLQPYGHISISPALAYDNRLNNLPQAPQLHPPSQLQLHLQPQPQMNVPHLPVSSLNGSVAQQPMVRIYVLN